MTQAGQFDFDKLRERVGSMTAFDIAAEFRQKYQTMLSESTARNWLQGRVSPSIKKIIILAKILNCQIEDLYTTNTGGQSCSNK